ARRRASLGTAPAPVHPAEANKTQPNLHHGENGSAMPTHWPNSPRGRSLPQAAKRAALLPAHIVPASCPNSFLVETYLHHSPRSFPVISIARVHCPLKREKLPPAVARRMEQPGLTRFNSIAAEFGQALREAPPLPSEAWSLPGGN